MNDPNPCSLTAPDSWVGTPEYEEWISSVGLDMPGVPVIDDGEAEVEE